MEIEVKNCKDCHYCNYRATAKGDKGYCSKDVEKRDVNIRKPLWCPLRKEPITIKP